MSKENYSLRFLLPTERQYMKPMGQKKTGKAKAKEIMTKTCSQWDARMSNILSALWYNLRKEDVYKLNKNTYFSLFSAWVHVNWIPIRFFEVVLVPKFFKQEYAQLHTPLKNNLASTSTLYCTVSKPEYYS